MNDNKRENNFDTSRLVPIYILFIILLMVSGSLNGIFSEIFYYLAFLLPGAICLLVYGKNLPRKNYLKLSKDDLTTSLPCIAPSIVLIALISSVTSFVISALGGGEYNVDLGSSLPRALLLSALLPALLEEFLFRYVPMRLLSGNSRRDTVIISALFFSLSHLNFYTIPYAFVAGIVLMSLDVATDSILPSFALHLLNNVVSILIIFYPPTFIWVVIGVLAVLSLIVIALRRKFYVRLISYVFDKGDGLHIGGELIVFALITLFISLINFI